MYDQSHRGEYKDRNIKEYKDKTFHKPKQRQAVDLNIVQNGLLQHSYTSSLVSLFIANF